MTHPKRINVHSDTQKRPKRCDREREGEREGAKVGERECDEHKKDSTFETHDFLHGEFARKMICQILFPIPHLPRRLFLGDVLGQHKE